MKYSMVKQFSNGIIDNIFKFFFKIVDFGKMTIEFFWAFLEIWFAFYLIFYNIFMYIYYLFLFIIDRGAETSVPMFRLRNVQVRSSHTPSFALSNEPNPIPAMYRTVKTVSNTAEAIVSSTAETAISTLTSLRSSPSGGKKPFMRTFIYGIIDFFKSFASIIVSPFKVFVNFFDRKLKPVKEEEGGDTRRKSLIDEYIKEYEQKRRR